MTAGNARRSLDQDQYAFLPGTDSVRVSSFGNPVTGRLAEIHLMDASRLRMFNSGSSRRPRGRTCPRAEGSGGGGPLPPAGAPDAGTGAADPGEVARPRCGGAVAAWTGTGRSPGAHSPLFSPLHHIF